jgi:arsenite methyltransferase
MTHTCNLYENDAFKRVTGPAIRPGGVELTDRALAVCGLSKGDVVLDLGCGRGATALHLKRHHGLKVVGLDRSTALLTEARQAPLPLVCADAARIPLPDGYLAAVCCECVLSLTPDPDRVLTECFRVLAPGGFLLLSDLYLRAGAAPSLAIRTKSAPSCCLDGATTQTGVRGRVNAAGFQIRLWEDHSHSLKVLAAQLVFAYGSMNAFRLIAGRNAFWRSAGRTQPDLAEATRTIPPDMGGGRLRPGYYLLVGRKEFDNG